MAFPLIFSSNSCSSFNTSTRKYSPCQVPNKSVLYQKNHCTLKASLETSITKGVFTLCHTMPTHEESVIQSLKMFGQQANCLLITPFPVSFFFFLKKASPPLGLKNPPLYSSLHRTKLVGAMLS